MTQISKSPERHTFQADNYIKRCEEEGTTPSEDYLDLYKSAQQQDNENMIDPKWQKDNMEYDLRSTEWILEKVRGDEVYAQNLYAAMCNNEFTKREMWPILKEQKWSRSWRSAGGIVADMREEGDYIDWYCSGIRNGGYQDEDDQTELTVEQQAHRKKIEAYVPESFVTDEIETDLFRLGWLVVKYDDTKDI